MIGALFIGLLGSLHCVGMCGPVMMAFMGPKQHKVGFTLYHAGRIVTYVMLGGLLGLIGASATLFHLQQALVLVLGMMLVLLYGVPSLRHSLEKIYYQSTFYGFLRSFLVQNISMRRRWFLSGVANGFFPCGLTYVAAAGAVAFGNPIQGALFMVLFGLGTLPSLIVLRLAGNSLFSHMKQLIPKSVTVLAILSGSIMITRGLMSVFPHFNDMVRANAASLVTICGL